MAIRERAASCLRWGIKLLLCTLYERMPARGDTSIGCHEATGYPLWAEHVCKCDLKAIEQGASGSSILGKTSENSALNTERELHLLLYVSGGLSTVNVCPFLIDSSTNWEQLFCLAIYNIYFWLINCHLHRRHLACLLSHKVGTLSALQIRIRCIWHYWNTATFVYLTNNLTMFEKKLSYYAALCSWEITFLCVYSHYFPIRRVCHVS